MKRYFTRPRLADIDAEPDAENYLARTVYEPDDTPYETGILDAQGNKIFAAIRMDQIGFVRSDGET